MRPIYNPPMRHIAVPAAVLLGLSSLAHAQGTPSLPPPQTRVKLENPAQIKSQGSYSLGLSMGESLRRASVDARDLSTPRLVQGIRDALAGKATFGPADQQKVRALIAAARRRVANENHAAARAFLARNGKKKGVVTTSTGLEYQVLKPGEGTPPTAGDTVTVNYRGSLLDGKVFDSSYERGKPTTFPVDRVIPGWQQALKLMKPGAEWRIFVPPQLAYDVNSPPPIPPGSLLVFEVNLLSVQPPQAQPGPQVQPPSGQLHHP